MVTGAALLVGSMGCLADTTDVTFGDEDVASGVFQISNKITSFSLARPLVCGTVGTIDSSSPYFENKINAYVAGSIPANGSFLFGGGSTGVQQPLRGLGGWKFSPTQGLVIEQGDPTLVCYSLNIDGSRKPTSGLFSDTFDLPYADAGVAVRVVQLPTVDNNFIYRYYIDVNVPVLSPSVSVPFTIRDGYDSSVFAAPGSSAGAGYCEVAIGVTTCQNSPLPFQLTNLDKPLIISAGATYSKRFIVSRPLRSDVSNLPNTGRPLVLASVFTPNNLEDRLDNNVSSGFGSLSDFDPIVTTTGTNLSGLSEGGILPGVTFSISDDTTETTGLLLDAQVKVDFNGLLVPTITNCGSSSPIPGPGSSRTCTFDVVPPSANFATDVAAGTYASNVYANVVITATDPLGHATTRSLPLHIASSDNDAPTFTLSPSAVPDAANGNMPTLDCNLSRNQSTACLGLVADIAANMKPGPNDAVDELASQSTWLAHLADGSLACTDYSIFTSNGKPKYVINGSHVDLDYRLNTVIMGEATCNVTLADSGYPSGQSLNELTKQIRIRVAN